VFICVICGQTIATPSRPRIAFSNQVRLPRENRFAKNATRSDEPEIFECERPKSPGCGERLGKVKTTHHRSSGAFYRYAICDFASALSSVHPTPLF
jgi:hypothetical protein